MPYNPISFNVLRQAMRWANLPACKLYTVSTQKWIDGSRGAIYRLTFDYQDCISFKHMFGHPGETALVSVVNAVQGSFCEDITTVSSVYVPETDRLAIELWVRVTKHSKEV